MSSSRPHAIRALFPRLSRKTALPPPAPVPLPFPLFLPPPQHPQLRSWPIAARLYPGAALTSRVRAGELHGPVHGWARLRPAPPSHPPALKDASSKPMGPVPHETGEGAHVRPPPAAGRTGEWEGAVSAGAGEARTTTTAAAAAVDDGTGGKPRDRAPGLQQQPVSQQPVDRPLTPQVARRLKTSRLRSARRPLVLPPTLSRPPPTPPFTAPKPPWSAPRLSQTAPSPSPAPAAPASYALTSHTIPLVLIPALVTLALVCGGAWWAARSRRCRLRAQSLASQGSEETLAPSPLGMTARERMRSFRLKLTPSHPHQPPRHEGASVSDAASSRWDPLPPLAHGSRNVDGEDADSFWAPRGRAHGPGATSRETSALDLRALAAAGAGAGAGQTLAVSTSDLSIDRRREVRRATEVVRVARIPASGASSLVEVSSALSAVSLGGGAGSEDDSGTERDEEEERISLSSFELICLPSPVYPPSALGSPSTSPFATSASSSPVSAFAHSHYSYYTRSSVPLSPIDADHHHHRHPPPVSPPLARLPQRATTAPDDLGVLYFASKPRREGDGGAGRLSAVEEDLSDGGGREESDETVG